MSELRATEFKKHQCFRHLLLKMLHKLAVVIIISYFNESIFFFYSAKNTRQIYDLMKKSPGTTHKHLPVGTS